MRLVRIEAPHFVAGIMVGVAAAPIVHYMRAWDVGKIVRYCKRRRWRVVEVVRRAEIVLA